MAHERTQGLVTSLPTAIRYTPVPLLQRSEVRDFVTATGASDEEGNLHPGQILRHPDGVTNVRITHPTDDPTILLAYCVLCKKVMNEATMGKHCRLNNNNTCKLHPALSRVGTAAVPVEHNSFSFPPMPVLNGTNAGSDVVVSQLNKPSTSGSLTNHQSISADLFGDIGIDDDAVMGVVAGPDGDNESEIQSCDTKNNKQLPTMKRTHGKTKKSEQNQSSSMPLHSSGRSPHVWPPLFDHKASTRGAPKLFRQTLLKTSRLLLFIVSTN